MTETSLGMVFTVVKGQCASKVHWSTAPVEAGVGEPCGSKGTMDIGVLEITKVPRNGCSGIRASS